MCTCQPSAQTIVEVFTTIRNSSNKTILARLGLFRQYRCKVRCEFENAIIEENSRVRLKMNDYSCSFSSGVGCGRICALILHGTLLTKRGWVARDLGNFINRYVRKYTQSLTVHSMPLCLAGTDSQLLLIRVIWNTSVLKSNARSLYPVYLLNELLSHTTTDHQAWSHLSSVPILIS